MLRLPFERSIQQQKNNNLFTCMVSAPSLKQSPVCDVMRSSGQITFLIPWSEYWIFGCIIAPITLLAFWSCVVLSTMQYKFNDWQLCQYYVSFLSYQIIYLFKTKNKLWEPIALCNSTFNVCKHYIQCWSTKGDAITTGMPLLQQMQWEWHLSVYRLQL